MASRQNPRVDWDWKNFLTGPTPRINGLRYIAAKHSYPEIGQIALSAGGRPNKVVAQSCAHNMSTAGGHKERTDTLYHEVSWCSVASELHLQKQVHSLSAQSPRATLYGLPSTPLSTDCPLNNDDHDNEVGAT